MSIERASFHGGANSENPVRTSDERVRIINDQGGIEHQPYDVNRLNSDSEQDDVMETLNTPEVPAQRVMKIVAKEVIRWRDIRMDPDSLLAENPEDISNNAWTQSMNEQDDHEPGEQNDNDRLAA